MQARLLLVDDHRMVLEGLKANLAALAPGLRVDAVDDIEPALEAVRARRYDLVLLDWVLATCDGHTSIRRLRDAGCDARIVVVSGADGAAVVKSALELGAAGFVPKRYDTKAMVDALATVLAGGVFLPREALPKASSPGAGERYARLTPRQAEVFRAAARGLPSKMIARQLGIAESTVKSHLSAAFAAMGVKNRTEAAYQVSREGLKID